VLSHRTELASRPPRVSAYGVSVNQFLLGTALFWRPKTRKSLSSGSFMNDHQSHRGRVFSSCQSALSWVQYCSAGSRCELEQCLFPCVSCTLSGRASFFSPVASLIRRLLAHLKLWSQALNLSDQSSRTVIDLYTTSSPNGFKATIAPAALQPQNRSRSYPILCTNLCTKSRGSRWISLELSGQSWAMRQHRASGERDLHQCRCARHAR
jgi:hypothetical protein